MSYQIEIFTQTGSRVAVLHNASNIRRKMKVNSAPTLSFSIPADDPKTAFLTSTNEAKVWNTKKSRFEGLYCLEDTTDRWGSEGKFIDCNYMGVISRLRKEKNISYDTTATPKTPTQVITALLALQQRTPAITVGTIEPTTTFAYAIENANLLEAVFKLPDLLGGYIEVDEDRHLNWYNEPTGSPTREIRYQKQLRSMTRKVDHTSIINRLYAYGYGEGTAQLKLTDAGEAHEYIETTPAPTADTLQIDRITDLRITHPSTLLLWAQRVLAEYSVPIYSYTVDIVNLAEHDDFDFDLEEMTVGAIVRVVNSDLIDSLTGNPINVNVKVVSVDTDLSKPENITLELANATKSLSDLIGSTNTFKNIAENVACRIGAGQVTVQGTFTVDGWRTSGTTTIDGGNITAGTITAEKLTITPIEAGGAAADVNANTTTISGGKITTGTITAEKLTITPLEAGGAAADVNANTTTISGGKITTNTIDADAIKTSTLNAKTITLGTTGGDSIIKSGNYSAGSAGWQIKANGDAEFNNVTVRGTIGTASIGTGATVTVVGEIKSNNYDSGSPYPGWLISGAGGATFHDVVCRGELTVYETIGASGTISAPNLSATYGLKISSTLASGSAGNGTLFTPNGSALYWKSQGGTVYTIQFA